MGVQTLATGVFGPLPPGTAGLLLGRSSASLKEMLIHPGVIDSDYTREIKILASAPNNYCNQCRTTYSSTPFSSISYTRKNN